MFDAQQTENAYWATRRPADPAKMVIRDVALFYLGRVAGRQIRKLVVKSK